MFKGTERTLSILSVLSVLSLLLLLLLLLVISQKPYKYNTLNYEYVVSFIQIYLPKQ